MKNIVEFFNESLVNEVSGPSMVVCRNGKEAAKKAVEFEKCGSHIVYMGGEPELAAEAFEMEFEVITYQDKQSGHLYIPCTKEVEYAFCKDDETMQEHCERMGLDPEDFEF
jgi:hypothetical protein